MRPYDAFLERVRARRAGTEPGDGAALSAAPVPAANGAPAQGGHRPLTCQVCSSGKDDEAMLLCDECNRGFHTFCLDPPLPRVPDSDWYCAECLLRTGGAFGFEDGELHSLYSFWKRCEAFKRAWHERERRRGHAKPEDGERTLHDAEDEVEHAFWRLVHSTHELVDVEYGADVHSSTHGNAFPTMEQQPLNPYARSGWNLNNLPIWGDSLLRYIKSEISGMTVPWIYIGMMFSAFCWHNEDHYTYSINYQHWGEPKTWYGVPGADAYKFEEAMRRTAPELFDADPEILFQLVTMMSPECAQREGVRMYAVNQRANEFVVTYPKAYHSGFNQGFNLNEAVNFALPDWVMDGLECARRYQAFRRQPVFSHDELLITVAQHNQQLATAQWLQHAYRDMVERELGARERVRGVIREAIGVPDARVDVLEEQERPEAEYQCVHCRTLSYLSQVTTRQPGGRIACLDHAAEVCGTPGEWRLRLRFSDAYLETNAAKLAERAAVPVAWQQRVRTLLQQHPRPPLRTLQTLLQEGERIAYPLPELDQLRAFVAAAQPWVDRAQVFLTRRHSKKRGEAPAQLARRGSRRGKGAPASPPAASPTPESTAEQAGVDRSPAALLALCAEAEQLPFEAHELQALPGVVEQMHTAVQQAGAFLSRDPEAVSYTHLTLPTICSV